MRSTNAVLQKASLWRTRMLLLLIFGFFRYCQSCDIVIEIQTYVPIKTNLNNQIHFFLHLWLIWPTIHPANIFFFFMYRHYAAVLCPGTSSVCPPVCRQFWCFWSVPFAWTQYLHPLTNVTTAIWYALGAGSKSNVAPFAGEFWDQDPFWRTR